VTTTPEERALAELADRWQMDSTDPTQAAAIKRSLSFASLALRFACRDLASAILRKT